MKTSRCTACQRKRTINDNNEFGKMNVYKFFYKAGFDSLPITRISRQICNKKNNNKQNKLTKPYFNKMLFIVFVY